MKTRIIQQSEKCVILKKIILISLCSITTRAMEPLHHRPRSNSLSGPTSIVLCVHQCNAAKNHLNSIRQSYDRARNGCVGIGATSATILAMGILTNPISFKMLGVGAALGCLTAWLDTCIERDVQVLRTIDSSLLQEVAEDQDYESLEFQNVVRQELARRRSSEPVKIVAPEII